MAEEQVAVAATSPVPSDHKRKLDDVEADTPAAELNANSTSELEADSIKKTEDEGVTDDVGDDAHGSEPKRPRLEDNPDDLVAATENGYQEKVDEPKEGENKPKKEEESGAVENATPQEDGEEQAKEGQDAENNDRSAVDIKREEPAKEGQDTENNEGPVADDHQTGDAGKPLDEKPQSENDLDRQEQSKEEVQEPSAEVPLQGDISSAEQQTISEKQTMSRKMEVPHTKVGVLIGKAGDTIRSLQQNSGARIQITKDSDADLHSATRPVELIGTLENINKAEKLIKNVIDEADAGGSPSLVAKGFCTVQAAEAGDTFQIQVPNDKVGLIIGKGGETIKNLQTRSGARIQLIPQHPDGDSSKGKTVRVTGDKKQIETAKQMIMDVMNQPVRSSSLSGGYNQQQTFRSRRPAGPQWGGPRGPHHAQQTGHNYRQQRGPYPSQNQQYAAPTYGNYPPQQQAPRSSFGLGWEQRPPPHGGHAADAPTSAYGPSPTPASQSNYNYGQPYGPDYGQPMPYSQTAPAAQHPYGGHVQSGYGPQEQYGKLTSYGMPPQGSHSQSYSQPRANHPGDMPYQGQMSSNQSYAPNVQPQQPYPYASSGPMQQTYPAYGSAPAADAYNHPPPATASAPGYSQQSGQPVSGYVQSAGQQAPVYAQVAPAGGYGQYPSSQPGYPEQPASNTGGYGYQGAADPAYGGGAASAYGAQSTAQPAYAQPPPTQPGYDQSIPQSGGYGSAPVGYDSSQMYGAHR